MKKKNLFLLLTVLWLFNAGIGMVSLYMDYQKSGGPAPATDAMILAHGLYMVAALVAAVLTFLQYRKYRKDN